MAGKSGQKAIPGGLSRARPSLTLRIRVWIIRCASHGHNRSESISLFPGKLVLVVLFVSTTGVGLRTNGELPRIFSPKISDFASVDESHLVCVSQSRDQNLDRPPSWHFEAHEQRAGSKDLPLPLQCGLQLLLWTWRVVMSILT